MDCVDKITITNFEGVYEPAEDSWLMVNHLPEIKGSVLEIGCGTGIISVHLAHKGAQVTTADKNPRAVEATKFNSGNNGVEIEVLEGDMFNPVSGSEVAARDALATAPGIGHPRPVERVIQLSSLPEHPAR